MCVAMVIFEGTEACDDGNRINRWVSEQLPAASCGDGLVYADEEGCDDGNDVDTDDCLSVCGSPYGDGFVHEGVEAWMMAMTTRPMPVSAREPARCGDGLCKPT